MAKTSSTAGKGAGEQPGSKLGFLADKRNILIIAIAIIVGVEMFIVLGLKERHQISTYRRRAQNALKNQDWDTALGYYQKLLVIAPFSTPVNSETGDALTGKKEFDKAIQHYNTALNTTPTRKGINAKIGLVYVEKGDLAQAIPYFEKELKLDNQNADAIFHLGLHNYEQGEFAAAGLYFQKIIGNAKYEARIKELNQEMRAKAEAAVKGEAASGEATTKE